MSKESAVGEMPRKTVLVVDDEEDVRIFFSTALEHAGFNVVSAADGFEALEQVKRQPPDLVSLDLIMPKRSGVKFYRDLLKNKDWARIPIIIVTGHARDELGKTDLKELTMSGPGIYLEKPVRPDNYVVAIQTLLGMDTGVEEKQIANQAEFLGEVKNLVDKMDVETLKKIKDTPKKD